METPLITHTFIEMYMDNSVKMPLFENLYSGNKRRRLFESYGIFNGCKEAAEEIADYAINMDKQNSVIDAPNGISFMVDFVGIKIDDNMGFTAAYIPEKTRISNIESRFEAIMLWISSSLFDDYQLMVKALMHELMHVYQDYNLMLKGKDIVTTLSDSGYFNISPGDIGKRDISKIFYLLNWVETGAYIGTLHAECLDYKNQSFDSISDAVNALKLTPTYKKYENLYLIYERLKSVSADKQPILLSIINQMVGNKFKTYNGFVKWVNKRIEYAIKKMETNIPKIACEELKISRMMYPSNYND